MVRAPRWGAGSTKVATPAVPRRHINWLMSKSIPDAYNVPGENYDPTRGFDDGLGSGGFVDMNPQNSWWEWELGYLKAGTWTISVWAVKDDNRGIATFQVNGATVATIDLYAAANDYPGTYSSTTFVLASDQDVRFRVTNPTKRAAAIGYQISIRVMSLDRTAA